MTPEPSDCATRDSWPCVAEELAEDRVVEQRVARRLVDPRGVDVDDRRADLLDHRRERQMQLGGVLRNGLVGGLRRRGGDGGEAEGDGEGEAAQGGSPARAGALI